MNKLKHCSIFLSILLVLSLCFSGCTTNQDTNTNANATTKVQKEFDAFLEDEFKDTLLHSDPFSFHSLVKDPANFDITQPEVAFDDISVAQMKADEKENETCLAKLTAFNKEELTSEQQLTYDTMKSYLNTQALADGLYYFGSNYEPSMGIQSDLPQSLAQYQFYKKTDVDTYFKILEALPAYLKSSTDFETERAENGFALQDSTLEKTLSEISNFLDKKDDGCLLSTFNERVESLKNLTKEEIASYEEKNKDLVLNTFFPAFEQVKDALSSLKGKATLEGGLSSYEKGKKYYEYLVAAYASCDETVSSISDAIDNQMEKDMTNLMTLATDTNAFDYYENEDYGCSTAEEALTDLSQKMKEYYPAAPDVNYEVREIDPSMADDITVAYYLLPPIDDISDNYIYINVNRSDYDPAKLYPTLAHEGYPGHMLQNTYYKSICKYPIRQIMSFLGYTEGWAMYTEMGSYQLADLDSQCEGLASLCQLNDQLNYGMCCRSDIGVNYEGWSKEDLGNYLEDYGMNDTETVDSLYQSAIDNPGVYLSYYYGWLQMWNLKESAKTKLQDKFDVKEFNTLILDIGATSFSILKQKVNDYINENK